ncbi:hypothetical protein GR217_34435 [Rhizobium leguminosarum]|uniref:Uncharacterized protein n=1 Tax=Rhizobium ruizarguesonis TaxID=2081791 RepID=A0AAE4YXE3_9HYPH|nr:DUF6441 family protein [Rhizobium ruizarguesonis]NEI52719.1 hypothetical protein [Rhizobium ruizarguesonis]
MKIVYAALKGEFEAALKAKYQPLAEAGSAAMIETANTIKTEARRDIASAGFSKRWQNALRVDVYPKRGVSLNAAALVYHKIPYADVFETGATIRGKPRLWLPLKTTPKRIGRNTMTAERYMKEIGPLRMIKRPGKKPLLAGEMTATKAQIRSGLFGKVTLSRLRKGSGKVETKATGRTMVPLFVGVDSVKIRDRLSIREITKRAADRLGEIYLSEVAKRDVE